MVFENTSIGYNDYLMKDNPLLNYNVSQHLFSPEVTGIMHSVSTGVMIFNIFTLMFAMGAATDIYEIKHVFRRPMILILAMACQMLLLPAIGFSICIMLKLPLYQALSVLILTTCPSGANSNFFTYWMEGDLALSIIMTAFTTLLSFGGMPLNLWIYSKFLANQTLGINYTDIVISMAYVTGPTILGILLRYKSNSLGNRVSKVCSAIGWLGVIIAGILVLLLFWEDILQTSLNYALSALFIGVFGFIVGYLITLIFCYEHRACRTVAIEICCQNMVIAVGVILLSFDNLKIRGAMITLPTLYGLWQLFGMAGTILTFQLWRFMHRNDVTVEDAPVEVDTSILYRIPIPARGLHPHFLKQQTDIPEGTIYNDTSLPPDIGNYMVPNSIFRGTNEDTDTYELQTMLPPTDASIQFPPPPPYHEAITERYETVSLDQIQQPTSQDEIRNSATPSSQPSQPTGPMFSLNYVNDANVMTLNI